MGSCFSFFRRIFLAFFDFWGVTPGSRISRKFTREGAAVPSKPRPGIRSPLGGAGRSAGGRGAGAAGPRRGRRAFFCARAGRRRAFGGRAGRGARRRLPVGRRRAGPGSGAAKKRAAPARAQGARGGRGRAGRAVARRRGGRRGAGAHGVKSGGPGAGAKSAGRAGRGGVFFGAPFFWGGGRKNLVFA